MEGSNQNYGVAEKVVISSDVELRLEEISLLGFTIDSLSEQDRYGFLERWVCLASVIKTAANSSTPDSLQLDH